MLTASRSKPSTDGGQDDFFNGRYLGFLKYVWSRHRSLDTSYPVVTIGYGDPLPEYPYYPIRN